MRFNYGAWLRIENYEDQHNRASEAKLMKTRFLVIEPAGESTSNRLMTAEMANSLIGGTALQDWLASSPQVGDYLEETDYTIIRVRD